MNLRRIALFSTLVAALPFSAQASLALSQKHACVACHAVDKKLVGPSYQDVAKKYAGDKQAVTKLGASMRAGGAGKWGAVPMPPQPGLNEADAKTLATWIVGGAK